MNGLGLLRSDERIALRRLSPATQLVVLNELNYDPSQADAIKMLLREPNPERAIADQIAAEVTAATYGVSIADVGMGRSLAKAFKSTVSKIVEAPKNIATVVSNAAKTITADPKRAVSRGLAPFTGGASLLLDPKFRKKTAEYAKTYGPMALTVGGIVAAPFTGGATLAIPALVQGYMAVQQKKREAKAAAAANQATAASLNSQASQMEAQNTADIDAFYNQNQGIFTNAGYPPNVWSAMSTDQKYAALNKLQGAAEAVGNDMADAAGSTQAPPDQAAPSSQSPAGTYDLIVEGQKVASAGNLNDLAPQIESLTKPGDRFEILFNGQSTGLKLRSTAGVISVPADQEAQVRAMSPDQVKAVVSKSEATAGQSKGGFPLWILAVPAAAFVATR
jgi:hypothetical protein